MKSKKNSMVFVVNMEHYIQLILKKKLFSDNKATNSPMIIIDS